MVSTDSQFSKIVADLGFQGAIFQQDDFMMAKVLHKEVELNKPIYIGMVTTDMYEFYYDAL